MKILKYLLTGVGLIILLVVVALSVFLATFDANQYKQDLSDLVQKQTGRELTFKGDIGLSLYPALGMKLGSFNFANAEGFGNEPMLSVEKASVSVDVLSLLSFSPEIEQLVLDGLNVNLSKNAEGKTNWDDLVQPDSEQESQAVSPDKEQDQSSGQLGLAGRFGGLNITHANVTWKDDSSGETYQIKDLSLTSGTIQLAESFPLNLSMQLHSPKQLDSSVSLSSTVTLEKNKVLLSALKLTTEASGEMIPVDQLSVELNGDVSYELEKALLAVKGFSTRINSQGGALQKADVMLAGELGFDVNQQQLTIAALDLQAELKDPAVPAGQMKTGVSASELDLRLKQNALDLKQLKLALNEYEFNGFVKVKDYTKPAVEFELASEFLDVDNLMGVASQPDTGPEPKAEEASTPEDIKIELPMELLRSLQVNGELKVAKLVAQKLTMNNIRVKVVADQGVIDVKPFSLALYDGKFDGAVQVDARNDVPVYQVQKKLSSFQVGQFLQDFMGDDMVSGEANIDVDMTTRGDWLSQLKSGLDGNIKIHIADGALKGFNLRHQLDSAKAKLRGQKAPDLEQKKTDFSALSLSGVVNQGVFSSEDLVMQAPLLRVGGKGSADIAKETVDYLVNAKIVGTSKGQQGGDADDLSGVEIPVAIRGPWVSPEIDVQLDEMMRARLDAEKEQIRNQIAQEKAEIQKQLAAEKAKLKAAQDKKLEAERLKIEKQKQLAEAELEAKKQAEKDKAKKKLEDKLKKLF